MENCFFFSIESHFQNVKPWLKFPIDETQAKVRAEDAFEEKDVSLNLAVFRNTDYQAFDSRNKYKSFVLFFFRAKSVEHDRS